MLPPLLNVRSSLLVVWSTVEKKRKKKRGEKKKEELGFEPRKCTGCRPHVHDHTICSGARGTIPGQQFRESKLSYQTAGRMALAAKPPAFGPDRQGDLLQQ